MLGAENEEPPLYEELDIKDGCEGSGYAPPPHPTAENARSARTMG
jgi:hypothetical protein